MSWVTDVLLIFSLGEVWADYMEPIEADENGESVEEPLPLRTINAWLIKNNQQSLNRWDEYVNTGKPMQSRIYGGAYNFLKISEFVEVVKAQPWQEPQNMQLLIKDDPEDRFTLYTLST
ncbi:hypothetical protein H6F76_28440 [Leptolyngbya sp. FACHB-321]|uniref:hypothetical protein n=1 Tax=Leptolyngbya sp. FACHB-321 TaxID=2692807 RepID=UPI0016831DB1|nr:hypothetical protein [Leptolyngbya sp. FACHB-321]MBD2038883.1 hypothetical protein [Leptolyngbya sp. FACHB-321]